MANLLGQNIGTNYKGILNLNTLNGNLSGTLQAVTDGDGNASPLQLSTTQVNVGGGTALGRLVVRGDGTNPIARFEDNTGTYGINITQLSSLGTISWINGGSYLQSGSSITNFYSAAARIDYLTWVAGSSYALSNTPVGNVNATSGTHGIISTSGVFAAGAGSANFRLKNIAYTINNSGAQTGTATGIFLNATETALNGMTHNLMDLGTGGGTYVSRFNVGRVHDAAFRFNSIPASNNWRPLCSISRIGTVGTASLFFGVGSGGSSASAFIASSNDELYLGTDTSNTFTTNIVLKANAVGFVGFGGLTSAFPALKRNAAALDVRLADDSGYADVNAKTYVSFASGTNGFVIDGSAAQASYGFLIQSFNTSLNGKALTIYSTSVFEADATAGGGVTLRGSGDTHTAYASALFAMKSTTKGFLPPQMTTAQRDLIAAPAAGLVIYNTSTNVLNFYNGTAWAAV